MKYQILLHIKDPEYECPPKGEEKPEMGYVITFKGVFNSIKEGLDFIFHKFEPKLREKHIAFNEIGNDMTITRIDPIKCYKWEKLYLNQETDKL